MPEFPLSRPDLKRTEQPREYLARSGQDFEGARHWRLVQVSHYANLQPSQIVREMDAPDRGWDDDPVSGDEHAPRAARQDATADADRQRENTELVTIDHRRYVVDPIVEGHTFKGLWTGGPVQHYVAKDNHKYLRQTLTRTWCAGHGYTVDEDGAYVAVMPGSDSDSDYDSSDSDSDSDVREFRSAAECLKACRPWMDSKLSPYMVLREEFPKTFMREVYWREFTHESITALEALGEDKDALREVVKFHFGEKVAGSVADAHCRVDPATNTVIFVCSLLYAELQEPKTVDELIALPCIDAPCSRKTLRMFGWNHTRDGEGYEYTHTFRWPRLKDSPITRALIEFVRDNVDAQDSFLLKLLEKHRHNDKEPGWWTDYEDSDSDLDVVPQLDNTGRVTESDAQHYRIADQKIDADQDGSLVFSIVIAKAEWHGHDDGKNYEDPVSPGTRQLASVQNPGSWGESEHRVIPSVPRDNAISTMLAITAGSHEVITQKSQSEGQNGGSDVSFVKEKTFDYAEATPDGVQNPFGPEFDAPGQSFDPYPRPTYSLTYEKVEPDAVDDVIAKAKSMLGGNAKVSVQYHPGNYYTVRVTGTDKNPEHLEEWCVEADWFMHHTVEEWHGVTLVRDSNGKATGFKFKPKVYDSDGDVDWDDTDAQEWTFVSFDMIRGDLDANWMGSDPQMPASPSTDPTVYYTTGKGESAKSQLSPAPSHHDEHGTGWSSADSWTDPDSGGDSDDKERSHVKTRISRRLNQDGTYDITVTRTYPHQRKWEWTTKQKNANGDVRTIYHAVYKNWASRRDIQNDIVNKFLSGAGGGSGQTNQTTNAPIGNEWEDGWSLSGSISVNEFGLVDAPGLTLTPNWDNDKKHVARAETSTDRHDETFVTIEKTYRAPQGKENDKPTDGYWWRKITSHVKWGTSTDKGEATREYGTTHLTGSKGLHLVRGKGVNAVWSWHTVYQIDVEPTWSGGPLSYSAGGNGNNNGGNGGQQAGGGGNAGAGGNS